MTDYWKEMNGKIYFSPELKKALKAVASETPVRRRRHDEWEQLLKSFGIVIVTRKVVNAAKYFCSHFRSRDRQQFSFNMLIWTRLSPGAVVLY